MAVVWRLDKRRHTYSHCALLFCYRRLGNKVSGWIHHGKWRTTSGRRILWRIHIQRRLCWTLLPCLHSADGRYHFRRSKARRRARFKIYDACSGGAVSHYNDFFGHKTRCAWGRQVFPDTKLFEFFMDDGRFSNGTDVLFFVYRNGNSDNLRLIYEKERINWEIHWKRWNFRHWNRDNGGSDDYSCGIRLLWRQHGKSQSRSVADVHYYP